MILLKRSLLESVVDDFAMSMNCRCVLASRCAAIMMEALKMSAFVTTVKRKLPYHLAVFPILARYSAYAMCQRSLASVEIVCCVTMLSARASDRPALPV